MPLTIPIAHDFICPWCWVGLLQVRKLQAELGIRVEWRGYELYPEELEWPEYASKSAPTNRPTTPSRFDLMIAAEGIVMPSVERPHHMRTYYAHQTVEYAKTEGDDVADRWVEVLYRAYWERGEAINDLAVLRKLAGGVIADVEAMLDATRNRRFRDAIVHFDDDAYARGVYNVPTFFIGGDRYAEQPYAVLATAVKQAQEEHGGLNVYGALEFPSAPTNRPYVFLNMVATIDGKIITGNRDEPVTDLGSAVDHTLLRRTEKAADAVMTGAQTLRATSAKWNPKAKRRFVVSRSGRVPADHAFFTGGEGYVVTAGSAMFPVPSGVKVVRAGNLTVDFRMALERIRSLGVQRLLVTGGSELNAQLLKDDLIDEIFLTVAPKVKLGADVPTIADGEALPRHALLHFELVEHHVIADEVFLRYRRRR